MSRDKHLFSIFLLRAGLPVTVNGDGLVQDVTKHGHYSVRYGFGLPFQGTLTTILDTDYRDFAVVYSCTNSLLSGMFHSEYIWILSRDGTLSNPTRQNIYEKLDDLKINRSGLQVSDRSGCPLNNTIHRESDGDLTKPVTTISPITLEAKVTAVPSTSSSSPPAKLLPSDQTVVKRHWIDSMSWQSVYLLYVIQKHVLSIIKSYKISFSPISRSIQTD